MALKVFTQSKWTLVGADIRVPTAWKLLYLLRHTTHGLVLMAIFSGKLEFGFCDTDACNLSIEIKSNRMTE